MANAQDRAETRRAAVLRGRSANLERRAVEALKDGRQDMAEQADADAVEGASRRFADKAARLRRSVANAAVPRRPLHLQRALATAAC